MRAASRRPFFSSYSANKISSWHIPRLVLVVFSLASVRSVITHTQPALSILEGSSTAQNFHRLHFSHEKGLGRPEGKKLTINLARSAIIRASRLSFDKGTAAKRVMPLYVLRKSQVHTLPLTPASKSCDFTRVYSLSQYLSITQKYAELDI